MPDPRNPPVSILIRPLRDNGCPALRETDIRVIRASGKTAGNAKRKENIGGNACVFAVQQSIRPIALCFWFRLSMRLPRFNQLQQFLRGHILRLRRKNLLCQLPRFRIASDRIVSVRLREKWHMRGESAGGLL